MGKMDDSTALITTLKGIIFLGVMLGEV